MNRQRSKSVLVMAALTCVWAAAAPAANAETFTGTAAVKTAGASATAPITVVLDRTMSQQEADTLLAAYKSGGAAALRKALQGVKPTGSIQLASGPATITRMAVERQTDKGRLITIVSDSPILHLGSGVPGAKPKEGYDFAVLDLEIGPKGGSGTLTPAARIAVKGGAFVVDGYASDPIRLTGVSAKK